MKGGEMRLRKKIGMFFIFSCIVPVIIILLYILNQNAQNIRDVNKKEIRKTVGLVNRITRQEIEKGLLALDYLKSTVEDENIGKYKLQNALYDISGNFSNLTKIFFVNDGTGEVEAYPSSDKDKNIKGSEWYREAKREKNYISLKYDGNNNVLVMIAQRVNKGNRTMGVVAVELNLNMAFSELSNAHFSKYTIIDRDTREVVFPKGEILSDSFLVSMSENIGTEEISTVNVFKDSQEGLINYYREEIRNTGWILVGRTSIGNLKRIYGQSQYILYASIGIIILLSIFSVVLLDNIMVEPLVKVKDKMKQASSGNYGIRIFVDSDDEIGELCSEFNYLMKKINRKMKKMDEGTRLGLSKEDVTDNIELDEALDNLRNFDLYNGVEEDKIEEIVEKDEDFKAKQKELVHRSFDQWRAEYYKTIEAKKKKIAEQVSKANKNS